MEYDFTVLWPLVIRTTDVRWALGLRVLVLSLTDEGQMPHSSSFAFFLVPGARPLTMVQDLMASR